METDYLARLGVNLDSAAKMPDVVVHDTRRHWLRLIEAVTTAGPVDGKRRKELKELFAQARAGLVFVTAFETRRSMQPFLSLISFETEVWLAETPDHLIHFVGEQHQFKALKRAALFSLRVPPFQGFMYFGEPAPGRCPGLAYCCPFGTKSRLERMSFQNSVRGRFESVPHLALRGRLKVASH